MSEEDTLVSKSGIPYNNQSFNESFIDLCIFLSVYLSLHLPPSNAVIFIDDLSLLFII